MNINALKTFAPAVRSQLMETIGRKLDFVLSAQTPDYLTTYRVQVDSLRRLASEDRYGLIERVSYTWFNRLAALRYLDARIWHPFRSRVLMAASSEETQPEILKLMRSGSFPDDLRKFTNETRLNDLLDGRIPSTDPQGEVYRQLVLATCRFYNALLPDLFELIDDETELLLPDDLLTEHSIVHSFRTEIKDEECSEVEVLGWLYQFYISEKKDAVMARKSAVPSEDIPAVTQLFTPHWIVRYLVENSLGRLWLLNRPQSQLREKMPYYIEGEQETEFLKIDRPEEIRLLDPAAGSGHMLTYAFDLLFEIYEEEGYPPSDIPALILKHNLYGVDICPRAAQLASLALVLKAREKSRQFFNPAKFVPPQIMALQNITFNDNDLNEYVQKLELGELFNWPMIKLMHQFEHATTFGSLIQPVLSESEIIALRNRIEEKDLGSHIFLHETHKNVLRVLDQAEMLMQRYHVVVANPPYMKNSQMNFEMARYANTSFKLSKANLCTCFLERHYQFIQKKGYAAIILLQGWMFTTRYELLRQELFKFHRFTTVAHLGTSAFDSIGGEVVQTVAFISASYSNTISKCVFFDLRDGNEEKQKDSMLLAGQNRFDTDCRSFKNMPSSPMAYWASKNALSCFANKKLFDYAELREGIATGKNERFVRIWNEVSINHLKIDAIQAQDVWNDTNKSWVPLKSGGSYRKWYGNNEKILKFDCLTYKELKKLGNHCASEDCYFKPSLTWSDIGGAATFGVRFCDTGFVFTTVGHSLFADNSLIKSIAAFLCSEVATHLAECLNPTLHANPGDIARLPFLPISNNKVTSNVDVAVSISRKDWDNFETSWDFASPPMLRSELKAETLSTSWQNWKDYCDSAIRKMQELETENNRLFIEAYGLQDELAPEVPEDQITLARADKRKDMAPFLSYAVGCMMGRYSLDKEGLILADAGDTIANYEKKVGKPLSQLKFAPDKDGIIPVLDGEWFEDDIVARTREFLRITFGKEMLTENQRFIEEALGKDLRKYFLTEFYKNHYSNERAYGYKKRPIYWLIQSPNKGFSALIYLHRYTKDTMNLVLNNYLRPYQEKLRSRLSTLAQIQITSEGREKNTARKEAEKLNRILRECEEWERQTILPLAQARIELDLDDGVKVNYQKLGEALATIPGLAAKDED